MKSLILAIAAICLLGPAVFADQVTLKNGDRLTGDILRSDDKVLVLKSEFAGEVSIQWAAVDAITSSQPLHVGLKDGQTVVGTVSAQAGKVQLLTKEAGSIAASKDSIVVIRSDKEQAAYDAALDRLQHPHLTDFWGGFLDAGLSTTKGNSDTLSFVLGAKAVRAAPSDKITVYMNSIYAKNNTTGTPVTTAHAITGGIRGDLNLNPKLFAFGFTDLSSISSSSWTCAMCWAAGRVTTPSRPSARFSIFPPEAPTIRRSTPRASISAAVKSSSGNNSPTRFRAGPAFRNNCNFSRI